MTDSEKPEEQDFGQLPDLSGLELGVFDLDLPSYATESSDEPEDDSSVVFPDDFYSSDSDSSCAPTDCDAASVTATSTTFDKNPVNVNILSKANLTATSKNPTNCKDKDGAAWSWSISSSEYRAQITDKWVGDPYKPSIDHPNPKSSVATMNAKVTKAGFWRFKAKATATWDCWDGKCSKNDETDWINLEVSNCDFKLELVPDDNFENRNLSRLGVGETGKIKVVPLNGVEPTALTPVTWECVPKEHMTILGGNELMTNFEAKGTAGRVKVCATVNGCKQCLNIDVIEPNCPKPEVCQTLQYNDSKSGVPTGAAMYINYYLQPADVSFSKIKISEEAIAPNIRTGGFDDGKNRNHPAWPAPVPVGIGDSEKGCLVLGPNKPAGKCEKHFDAAEGLVSPTAAPGALQWKIPWHFHLGGNSKKFATVTQTFLWKQKQNPKGMIVAKKSSCGNVAYANPIPK